MNNSTSASIRSRKTKITRQKGTIRESNKKRNSQIQRLRLKHAAIKARTPRQATRSRTSTNHKTNSRSHNIRRKQFEEIRKSIIGELDRIEEEPQQPPPPPATLIPPILKFLLVLHGSTASSDNLRYYTITNLHTVSFVAPHGYKLFSSEEPTTVSNLINTGNLEVVSEVVESTKSPANQYREINLPPIIFSPEQITGKPGFINTMGIFELTESETGIRGTVKTNNELFAEYPSNSFGYPYITYSKVEEQISRYIRTVYSTRPNMNDHIVQLKVYCCRGVDEHAPRFWSNVGTAIPPTAPQIISSEPARYVEMDERVRQQFRFEVLTFTSQISQPWSPLLKGLSYQGCGLNVLSSYGYIPYVDAESRASVLYKTGTSIYKFMDYVHTLWRTPDISMSAFKFKSLDAALRICSSILTDKPTMSIPIKLYWTDNVENESGHFITAVLNQRREVCIWDPQGNVLVNANEYFHNKQVHFASLIFINVPSHENARNIFLESHITQDDAIPLIRSRLNLMWGGEKTKTHAPTPPSKTTIESKEMTKINNIKYDLIKYGLAAIFCNDEFQMAMPAEDLEHLVSMGSSYKYTAPIKTISLNSIIMRTKSAKTPSTRVKSKRTKFAKTRKATKSSKNNRTRSSRFSVAPRGTVKV